MKAKEIDETEILEPTDGELELEALMEDIGEKIDRFIELTQEAGNGAMGKAVKKRWRKVKQSRKIKE